MTTMRKFDDVFTPKNLGYKDAEEYYKVGWICGKLSNVKVPRCEPASMSYARTSLGGHVGFITREGQSFLLDVIVHTK